MRQEISNEMAPSNSMATGFPYPLPWSKLAENIYSICNAISVVLFDSSIKSLAAARKRHGVHGQLAVFEPYNKDVPYICPSLPEIDLPMRIPSNAHLVGPILVPTQPLAQGDPDLVKWLQKGPTVLLNLGSLHEGTIDQARGMALGLRVLFNSDPKVQVLWKFKPAKGSDAEKEVEAILGNEIKTDRLKVSSWLQSEPLSILQSGLIVAAVHHGGANSWFEATWYVNLFHQTSQSDSRLRLTLISKGPEFHRLFCRNGMIRTITRVKPNTWG